MKKLSQYDYFSHETVFDDYVTKPSRFPSESIILQTVFKSQTPIYHYYKHLEPLISTEL